MTGPFAVETHELRRTYTTGLFQKKERVGLRGLTLQVHRGEVFGCLGPNGAGKSTTLKLLMGLIFPTSGRASILGMDVQESSIKRRVGFLPEQPYFYDYLTARELLDYYAQLSGVPAGDRKRKVPAMLERAGLTEAANTQLRKFSKGMLQRCGIAQAIIHDPEIVFLDEPMSGLDPVGRREVRELIASLHDEGKTIFFSTHILSDAEALCDRVAVLDKGALRGVCVVADLVAEHRGKVEITWQANSAIESLRRAESYRIAGETARALFAEEQVFDAIAAIRSAGARLISVAPVQGSLEEYFLKNVEARGEEQAR